MTILEAIQKSADFLAKKGVESARLQSELLLAHVLRMPRLKLYLDFGRNLSDEETTVLRDLVQRRGTREPLQHILGTASFCGLEIRVNSSVLVPRPETELLAEQGWKFLNSLGRPTTFLDFGTGSGCIAISVCHFAKDARGWALDRSAESLAVASENARKNSLEERLTFVESDAFSSLDQKQTFDLIISNPPYIPRNEIASLQEEVRKYDPHAALDGGPDGLDFYRLLANEAALHLLPGGRLIVEFGDCQEAGLKKIFSTESWTVESVLNDYTDRARILTVHREC